MAKLDVTLRVKDEASAVVLDLAKAALAAAVDAAVGEVLDGIEDAGLVIADASYPHYDAERERAERAIRKTVRKLVERGHDERIRDQG